MYPLNIIESHGMAIHSSEATSTVMWNGKTYLSLILGVKGGVEHWV